MKKVYTFGVFDLFHEGHLLLLQEAAALGDILIVGLFTDKVAASFKREPIIPYSQRKAILESINCVSKVIPQKYLSPTKTIKKYNRQSGYPICTIAKGPGATWENSFQEYVDIALPVLLPYHPGVSTSDIIEKIKNL